MKNKVGAIICVLLISAFLCSCANQTVTNEPQFESSKIEDICKLATVECYYHNVAKVEKSKNADNELLDFLKKDREMWIEYTGIAKIGIDVSKMEINVNQNIVEIKIPKPEIIDIYVDEDSYDSDSYFSNEDDWLVKNVITPELEADAIDNAQETMKAMVLENDAVFDSASERAKKLIQNYIDQIGEATGKTYTITWTEIDTSNDEASVETTKTAETVSE